MFRISILSAKFVHVGVMFAIYAIKFSGVDLIKATHGKYPQKSVWLFVYVLNVLCWPSLSALLDVQPGQHILDIACDNGLTSRCLAALGAKVTAFDFSENLIEKAKARPNNYKFPITYHVIDATNEQQ